MKNATTCAKKLTAVLKKLPKAEPPDFADNADPVAAMVFSFLLAESTTEKALAAYRRLREHVVDFNDLRVSMAQETAAVIGARYPRALERCQRLRAALRNVYLREHNVTLGGIGEAGKRDVKKYIESLEGMTPYVSARVLLVCYDTHGIPVDEQLCAVLVDAGAADPGADPAEVSAFLARQVRANEGLTVHYALQAWMDARPRERPRRKSTAKKSTARATPTRKKSARSRTGG